MKIMTIGGATKDTVVQYDQQEMLQLHTKRGQQTYLILEEGKKIEVNNLEQHTGGGATNSAASFKRLGLDVSILCKIGSDINAEFVLNLLKKEGLDTTHIARSTDKPTGTSAIIPSLSGDRCIFAYRGANTELKKEDVPYDAIKKSDWLYITSLSGRSSQLLFPITEFAKKNGIKVANNPGTSQLAAGAHALCQSLKNIDILILNNDEANEFMQSLVQTDADLKAKISAPCKPSQNQQAPQLISSPIRYMDLQFDIRDFFKEILSKGPKIVVVTNGAEGVYVATEKTVYFHPSLSPKKIANTLGAGDAFGSCFTAHIALGKPIEKALKAGILNSSSVIGHLDAKTGLLTLKELEKKLKTAAVSLIRKFDL